MELKARGEPRYFFCVGDCDEHPDMLLLVYKTVHPRKSIETGDVLFFEDKHGVLDDTVRFITREDFIYFIQSQRKV